MALDKNLAFIGGGVMAGAILRSLIDSGTLSPTRVVVSDPVSACRERAAGLGVQSTTENAEAVRDADVVVVAVKPQNVLDVLEEIGGSLTEAQLLVSIAPGITTRQLEEKVPLGVPVVRVMPNTPTMVGAGAAAFCLGAMANEEHAGVVRRLFEAGGRCVQVAEKQLDAVTGLSGSGPAYVCVMIEALADGGVRMGLPRDVALTLAAQTVMGAAKLVLETGDHPAVLKDRVATPGGTTIAGLAALEEAGLRNALIKAVEAATRRSAELGQ